MYRKDCDAQMESIVKMRSYNYTTYRPVYQPKNDIFYGFQFISYTERSDERMCLSDLKMRNLGWERCVCCHMQW